MIDKSHVGWLVASIRRTIKLRKMRNVDINELKGNIIIKIDGKVGDNVVIIYCFDGKIYKMHHEQDCCESVQLEDIVGDIGDIYDYPITVVEEVTSGKEDSYCKYGEEEYKDGDHQWTFYNISTVKATLTFRWLGQSNGYYSTSVSIVDITNKDK